MHPLLYKNKMKCMDSNQPWKRLARCSRNHFPLSPRHTVSYLFQPSLQIAVVKGPNLSNRMWGATTCPSRTGPQNLLCDPQCCLPSIVFWVAAGIQWNTPDMVFNWRWFCHLRDTVRGGVCPGILGSDGWRPGMLLNSLQSPGQLLQQRIAGF